MIEFHKTVLFMAKGQPLYARGFSYGRSLQITANLWGCLDYTDITCEYKLCSSWKKLQSRLYDKKCILRGATCLRAQAFTICNLAQSSNICVVDCNRSSNWFPQLSPRALVSSVICFFSYILDNLFLQ